VINQLDLGLYVDFISHVIKIDKLALISRNNLLSIG
jgi:hypothetical protein